MRKFETIELFILILYISAIIHLSTCCYIVITSKIGLYHLFLLTTQIPQQNRSSKLAFCYPPSSILMTPFIMLLLKTFEFLTDSVIFFFFFILAVPERFKQETKKQNDKKLHSVACLLYYE